MQNGTRPQLQETTSSAEITDEKFIEIELEGTVLPGCANQNAAAEETDNEYYTRQKRKNKIPKFGTSKKSSRAIIPAVGKEEYKSFSKSSAGAEQHFLELNRHKSVPRLRGKVRASGQYRNFLLTTSSILMTMITVMTITFLLQEASEW